MSEMNSKTQYFLNIPEHSVHAFESPPEDEVSPETYPALRVYKDSPKGVLVQVRAFSSRRRWGRGKPRLCLAGAHISFEHAKTLGEFLVALTATDPIEPTDSDESDKPCTCDNPDCTELPGHADACID